MLISSNWEFEDKVSGLKFKVVEGTGQNRLHVEHIGEPIVNNRDFFFDQDGEFDGTGSSVG